MSDQTKGDEGLEEPRQRGVERGSFLPFALRGLGVFVALIFLFDGLQSIKHVVGFFFYGNQWRGVGPSFVMGALNLFVVTASVTFVLWFFPALRPLAKEGLDTFIETFRESFVRLLKAQSKAQRSPSHVATFPNAVVTYHGTWGAWRDERYAATDEKLKRILESHPGADLSKHEAALGITIEDVQRVSSARAPDGPNIYV